MEHRFIGRTTPHTTSRHSKRIFFKRRNTSLTVQSNLSSSITDQDRIASQENLDDQHSDSQLKKNISFQESDETKKLIKLILLAKRANQTSTVLSLLAIEDLLVTENEVLCFLKLAGVKLLTNLLFVNHHRSVVTSLKLLSRLTYNKLVVDELIQLKGIFIEKFFEILKEFSSFNHTKKFASTVTMENELCLIILANVVVSKDVQKLVYQSDGFEILACFLQMDLMDLLPYEWCELPHGKDYQRRISSSTMSSKRIRSTSTIKTSCRKPIWKSTHLDQLELKDENQKLLSLFCMALKVFGNLCIYEKNAFKFIMMFETLVLTDLLAMQIVEIDEAVIGLINQCCINEIFCKERIDGGIVFHCIRILREEEHVIESKISASQALQKCLTFCPESKEKLIHLSGMDILMQVANKAYKGKNDNLVIASLSTLKIAIENHSANCTHFSEKGWVKQVIRMIKETPNNKEEIRIRCFGIIKEYMAQCSDKAVKTIPESDVLQIFQENLQSIKSELLVAVNEALANTSKIVKFKRSLLEGDVLRHAWSNLKSENNDVISSSARAIYYLVRDRKKDADVIRSYVGGLEILLKLLHKQNNKMLSSVCFVISEITEDEQTLAIMDDYGLLVTLKQLSSTDNIELKKALSKCWKSISKNHLYRRALHLIIPTLVKWLKEKEDMLKIEIVYTLYYLSHDNQNCKLMFQSGVVNSVIELIRSRDHELQEACATCLRNIRSTVHSMTMKNQDD